MRTTPILCKKEYPDGTIRTIYGGLCYIKRNNYPYFSITNDDGADHKNILKWFPEYQDLIDLHLSNIDGVPMYAYENGIFFFWSSVDGHLGEKFANDGFSFDKNLKFLADHLRIPIDMAKEIRRKVVAEYEPGGVRHKKRFCEIVNSMKPRWKIEALNCIKKYNLVIYGDPCNTD